MITQYSQLEPPDIRILRSLLLCFCSRTWTSLCSSVAWTRCLRRVYNFLWLKIRLHIYNLNLRIMKPLPLVRPSVLSPAIGLTGVQPETTDKFSFKQFPVHLFVFQFSLESQFVGICYSIYAPIFVCPQRFYYFRKWGTGWEDIDDGESLSNDDS